MREVIIHTDGACLGNPGPGGWAAILVFGPHRREVSGGVRHTTNNRMELLACIRALEALTEPCRVRLHSDSRYVVEAVEKGWAVRWRANGWQRGKAGPAKNPDLWARLLEVCAQHDVSFVWVKGHAGNVENERADELSTRAAREDCALPDPGFGV
jgi:ribonuclease HI